MSMHRNLIFLNNEYIMNMVSQMTIEPRGKKTCQIRIYAYLEFYKVSTNTEEITSIKDFNFFTINTLG